MGQGFRLFECPQSEIVDKVQMKPLGQERSLAIQTHECHPLHNMFASLNSFLAMYACFTLYTQSDVPNETLYLRKGPYW